MEICDYNELDAFWIFALFVKPRHKDIIKELFSILLPTQQEQSTPSPHPSLPAPTIPPSKTILPLPTSTSSSSLSSSSSSSTLSTSLLIIESLQDPLQSTSSISQLLPSPLPPTAIRISFIIRDIGQFDALLLQHSPPTHSHMKNVIGISDFTTVSVFRNWFASFFAIVMSSYTLEG